MVLAAAVAGLFVAVGCGSERPPPGGSAPVSPGARPATAASTFPATAVPPASGTCTPAVGWTAAEQTSWLRLHVQRQAGTRYISIVKDRLPLCQPLPVQIEFWSVAVTPGLFGGQGSLETTSISRKEFAVDGRTGYAVELAPVPTERCTGLLMAVYVGGPLTEADLPLFLDSGGLADTTVSFRGARVVYGAYAHDTAQRC
jgi:hypothetical protein